jgi:hypothetical protein
MAKKSGTKRGTSRGAKKTPSSKRAGAGRRAAAASKGGRRKTSGARTPQGKAKRKQSTNPPRPGKLKKTATRAAAPARGRAARAKPKAPARGGATAKAAQRNAKAPARRPSAPRRAGGTGREETLAQTPETGRTRRGLTNPMPTKRSTGTPAGAGTSKSPRLERARRQLRELDETVPSPPSSLDLDRRGPSAARSGRQHLEETKADHTETSPVMTGGDVDADWEDAYSVGDEAPGGDNPTPDQDRVDDIGKALGVTYDDNEELKASDKITERDKHRWELDPASSEDYPDRD